ncbi:hypothetical protein [Thermogemmatispora sp.]|uniref:hypothetical protein n=1 Tax=Thermogemmatispora sp. TaxID=1968838 RepID=UPI001D352B86|nr:hypothetical protein [Thermogemmatispora sp.]MBX5448555.1 hypothetical protein [Thermogemmatispora sp.]
MSQKGSVLIVTSDTLLGSLLQRALQAQGYETALCRSAAAALAQLATLVPTVLVVDLALSDDTGWGLLRQARARGLLAPRVDEQGNTCLPVVLLSFNPLQSRCRGELRPLACLPRICPLGAVLRLVAHACAQWSSETAQAPVAASETGLPTGEDWRYA